MTGPQTGKGEKKKLADLLAGLGLVDKTDLLRGLMLTRQSGSHLLRVVVDQGWVDEDRLTRALSSALGVEAVTPATMKIHERVLAMIPPKLALKHRALPVAIKRANQVDYLYVALADPLDTDAVEELQRASNCRLHVLVAPPTQLDAAIQRFYAAAASSDRAAAEAPGAERRARASVATPPPKAVLPAPKGSVSGLDTVRGTADLPKPNVDPSRAPIVAPTSSSPGLPPPRPSVQAPKSGGKSVGPAVSNVPRTPGGGTPRPPVLSAPPLPGFPQPRELPGLPDPKPVLPRSDSQRPPTFSPIDNDLVKTQLDSSLLELTGARTLDMPAPPQTIELPRMPPPQRPSVPELKLPDPPATKQKLTLPILPAAADPPRIQRSESDDGRSFDLDIEEAPALEPAPITDSAARVPDLRSVSSDEQPVELDEVIDAQELEEVPDPETTNQVATLRPQGSDKPHRTPVRLVEDADEATSQLEVDAELKALSDHFAGLEPARPAPPVLAPAPTQQRHAPQLIARTMELPVAPREAPSPFDVDPSLKAGLDRTAIIPVLEWDREGFDPPPMRPKPVPQLVSIDDIPSSPAAVRARVEVELPEPEPPAESKSEPREKKSPPPLPPPAPHALGTNGTLPEQRTEASPRVADLLGEVSVPSESVSKSEPKTAVTPAPRISEPLPPPPVRAPSVPPPAPARPKKEPIVEDLPTNPRLLASDVEAPSTSLRLDPEAAEEMAGPIEKAAEPWEVTPANPEPLLGLDIKEPIAVSPESQSIVDGFLSGDSLTSAERAQLLLALGKVLVRKGIISKEELMRALSE
ncbi:MAG: hypothetical protein U1E65_31675 [Myxococcota bacterium]